MHFSKFGISVFFFFLVLVKQAVGQDSLTVLLDSWIKLKSQLQRRTDIIINIVSVVSKSSKMDEDILKNVKSIAADFSLFIDSSKNLDSLTVKTTYQKSQGVAVALSKMIVMLENDSIHKSQDEYINLQVQLEAAENRIVAAKRNYNEICFNYKREDLIYDR